MTNEHIRTCARRMAAGSFGSFACTIGEALLLADSHNFGRLVAAFPDLIQRAADQIAYEQAAELIKESSCN